MTAPPPQRRLAHDGCSLAYRVEGQGPVLLLIQGVGVHGEGWRPQVDGLRDAFTCVSFDNRGVGASQPRGGALSVERMADDALALLDAEGVGSAHVAGRAHRVSESATRRCSHGAAGAR